MKTFVENAPKADESVKDLKRADGITYKNSALTDNWISIHKSGISCRLNVGVGDLNEQISGINKISAKSNNSRSMSGPGVVPNVRDYACLRSLGVTLWPLIHRGLKPNLSELLELVMPI